MPRLDVEKTIEELTLGEKVALTAGESPFPLQTKRLFHGQVAVEDVGLVKLTYDVLRL